MKYDYLIVGGGLYGCVFAHFAARKGRECLIVEKRDNIGGFCYTQNVNGIEVHKYGAHIFRTNSRQTWDYVNSIVPFVPFVNSPLASYRGETYNLPFNMNTFRALWGVTTPQDAVERIEKDRVPCDNPTNLEEHCLNLIGRELYEKFVKGYTEKQWGKKCTELPPSVMARIPVRLTYDNNYYRERYQGIPEKGYTDFLGTLAEEADIILGEDYLSNRHLFNQMAERIVYTGAIDAFFDYRFGWLDYRSVRFEHKVMEDCGNWQGNAVVNYTDGEVPYTRIIEHKHFVPSPHARGTIISAEYPCVNDSEPCYPCSDPKNLSLYKRYKKIAEKEFPNVIFGGRLAEYRYYSMNEIIEPFVTEYYGREARKED